VLAAGFPSLGIGFLGVSFAFGLTVLTMAYAVGHVSGGHFNCAVTIGLWAGGRFKGTDVLPYVLAQVAGAISAAAVLYAVASGKPDWVPGGFASNGYGDLSPGKYGLASCFLIEVIATFFFLYVIIGTTSKGAGLQSKIEPLSGPQGNERIQRERIAVGNGALFLNEDTEHARFQKG
jgi:aquaporin Z